MTLIPIGRFAKVSRLSVKSLRNYDQSGLLPAAFVDPQTSYRYYRLEQLARADAIRSLRMVDMPLHSIEELLDGDDPERVLTSHLVALQSQRDELDQMAQQLQRRINRREYIMSTEITVKASPPVVVAAYRTATTHDEIFSDIPNGFAAVMAALAEAEVDPVGVPFTLFHQAPDADTDGDIAMCVPIDGAIEHTGNGVETVQIAAETTASVLHRGSYADMGESYAAVAAWIHERGHRIVGPQREVYLNSPAEVADEGLLTEIHFAIDSDGEG
ncbi:MAG: MerR family transcriptional regulator [Microthrixaceae bacterium]|nr:MerR family transcriptional regulator [Microthrixaceae bacterium]